MHLACSSTEYSPSSAVTTCPTVAGLRPAEVRAKSCTMYLVQGRRSCKTAVCTRRGTVRFLVIAMFGSKDRLCLRRPRRSSTYRITYSSIYPFMFSVSGGDHESCMRRGEIDLSFTDCGPVKGAAYWEHRKTKHRQGW